MQISAFTLLLNLEPLNMALFTLAPQKMAMSQEKKFNFEMGTSFTHLSL